MKVGTRRRVSRQHDLEQRRAHLTDLGARRGRQDQGPGHCDHQNQFKTHRS